MSNQAKVIFASFIYFALVMEQNEYKVSDKLKMLFRKLARNTEMYSHRLNEVLEDINKILKDIDVEVDYMLLSVTILAEYYEQLRGKPKRFYVMSNKQILMLQDECLEMSDKNYKDTFMVAEKIVKGLLND